MKRDRAWSFTAALLITLALMGAIALTWTEGFRTDANGYRVWHLRQLEHQAQPVWTELATAFKQQTPPNDMAYDSRSPFPTLRRMVSYPMVSRAFLIAPDKHLYVVERTDPATLTATSSEWQVNLQSWKPVVLGQVWDYMDMLNKTPKRDRGPQAHALRREKWLQYTSDTLRNRWHVSSKRDPHDFKFHLVPGDMHHPSLFLMGDGGVGYLGFEPDFGAVDRFAELAISRNNLTGTVSFWSDLDVWDSPILKPERPVPALSFAHLSLASARAAELTAEWDLRVMIAIAFLAILGVFSTSLTIRHGIGLSHDRALYLAQSNFVSGVSHEMRTPLTTIKLYAEMMQEGLMRDPEQHASYLQTVVQECDRLTHLIDNVLDYARLTGHRRSFQFAPVALSEVVQEAVGTMTLPFTQAGMTLEVAVPAGLMFSMDRDAVVRSVINLLSNALKYATSGRKVIVRAAETPVAITLEVQDFGPGIPEREQRQIFKPFYRVGEAAERTGGSGLGLALVSDYMKAHAGRVEVSSQGGTGTTFRLVFPKRQDA